MPHTLHSRAGSHVIVTNGNKTAFRNHPAQEFNDGVVLSGEPLLDNDLFEVKIDKKINSWSGSIEIGVTTSDPHNLNFPTSATGFRSGTWVMSGSSVLRDGHTIIEEYGKDLDQLGEGDQVGVLKTDTGNLHFYVNGEDQGVAAENIPDKVFVVVDLYGKCCQVTILEESNRENVEASNEITEDNIAAVSLEIQSNDQLCFHSRCGSLVRLTRGRRTAERRRPLDEFNNGVIMTNRPLLNDELFEIRLDHLVDKWSGSIEIGISTHNPSTLEFPATMTNMRSGYIILNGCSILAHGKEILREYSVYNLDELREGDRIGLIRNSNGNLHFLINGIDQGLAISQTPSPVWGVVDLYGMAVKVSITDRRDRNQRRNEDLFAQQMRTYMHVQDEILDESEEEPADRLLFHTHCGSHAAVMAGARTACRPNAVEEFNNGVVLTSRMLKPGEMFEVRLDKIIDKWAGSIEIGVTTHSPSSLDFPSTMTNIRSGTWMMTGNGVMHNGTTVIDEYGQSLDRLQSGDRVAALRKTDGLLHFYVNGEDQGLAASNVPTNIYGVIDLYGQAAQATIIDHSSSVGERDACLLNHDDLRFNHLHGCNVVISQGGKTASRPNARGEFNDGIVMSNRPLRDNELFEINIDRMVDRWSGSIEAGVTLIHPEDIDFPSTMTDIDYETWMLSGSAIMQDGTTIGHGYKLDLDTLVVGSKLGMMHCSDGTLHFYLNGVDQGVACVDIPSGVYAVIDLYGQCAQVTISGGRTSHRRSDNQILLDIDQSLTSPLTSDMLHRFSQCCGKNIAMRNNGQTACRMWNFNHGLVFSTDPLRSDEIFEIKVEKINKQWSGSMSIGMTTMAISDCTPVSLLPASLAELQSKVTWFISGANVLKNGKVIRENYTPSLDRLDVGSRIGIRRCSDATMHLYVDGEDIGIAASNLPKNVFAVIDIYGTVEQVSITSSGFTEFLNSSRPPSIHSLESIDSIEDEELDHDTTEMDCFEFHHSHGKNINITNSNLTAMRTASYNQAVVISHKPLVRNKLFQVKIDKLNKKWSSSLCIGVLAVHPEKFTFPLTASSIKKQSWVIQGCSVFQNGVKTMNGYGPDLDNLLCGQTVGVLVDDSSLLHLYVNGVDQGIAAKDIPKCCYVIVDLYGKCEQISVVNVDGQIIESCNEAEELPEKGNKEEKKKEKIARPIDVETQTKNCDYFNMCARFRSTLGIPEDYFNHSFNRCFCECCHRTRGEASIYRQGDPVREYTVPVGWSRFGIRLPAKAEATNCQEKWHVGYTGAQISVIRTVLDSGDLLVMGEALTGRWSLCSKSGIFDEKNKPDEPVDTMPICLSPMIQYAATKTSSPRYDHRDPRTRKTQSLRLAFQVFIKPGSYKIGPQSCSRDTQDVKFRNSEVEWLTKERGATVVCGLLVKVE